MPPDCALVQFTRVVGMPPMLERPDIAQLVERLLAAGKNNPALTPLATAPRGVLASATHTNTNAKMTALMACSFFMRLVTNRRKHDDVGVGRRSAFDRAARGARSRLSEGHAGRDIR